MDDKEPYRATKLWNEVIIAFQAGMPLKKHRRRMQSYYDCFTASDAVTWLHCFLMNNPNFGPNVTRNQTINLLQKFFKCYVIESAILKTKKKEFLDDSHLYKFTSVSFHHSKPSALCLIQSPARHSAKSKKSLVANYPKSIEIQKENLPECHLVERKISPHEVKAIWEKVTLARLETLLPHVNYIEILDKKIDGFLIKHNVFRLSKTGVVCLIDKTDDIPHWVISAMKCLANWPNASGSGSCLPNYPGFEKDVFNVVKDYFINPQVPLLPEFLTSLLFQVFDQFVKDDLSDYCSSSKSSPTSDLGSRSKIPEVSSSVVKTSTPLGNDSVKSNTSSPQNTSEGNLLLDDPELMWEYPTEIYFETDFATTQPITRMISSQSSRCSSQASTMGSIDSVSTISVCSASHKSVVLPPKGSYESPLKAWSSNLYLQDEIKEAHPWLKADSAFSRLSFAECPDSRATRSYSMSLCPPEVVYPCEINDLNTSDLSSKTITASTENLKDASEQNSSHSFEATCARILSSQINKIQEQCNSFKKKFSVQFIKDNIYSESLKSSFQLILLFLPSANRRQLHLLLRLMNKILKNGKFIVAGYSDMRDHLLETFLPAIVQSNDTSVLSLYQMSAFLLDHCESIFQPPAGLKEEVAEICRLSSGRIRYTVDDTCDLTYCEMVSKQQYEKQKVSSSVSALKDLLNSIVQDKNIPEKEKKRKLKQFKNSHPDIYMLQFPEKEDGCSKPKSSFLNKLINLRM